MKKCIPGLILSIFLISALNAQEEKYITIPLGGNSWVISKSKTPSALVTDSGWINWKNNEDVFVTYIKLSRPGKLDIGLLIEPPVQESAIQCAAAGQNKSIILKRNMTDVHFGGFNINDAGYIKIAIKGISKKGNEFARVKAMHISGSAVDSTVAFVKDNTDNYFYWGRRGPSVHCNYDISGIQEDIEWFYNELTVPSGNDPIGTYAMAIGFGEGYFGIQVNSKTERRVLFSVWSPFETDNPKDIPDDKKILLLKKGEDVYTGEFGSEGSGGQSYLRYNWKAGNTYKFLMRVRPEANAHTSYTAYFFDPEKKSWRLIASFSRPATSTYLTRPHSFLENFEPEEGYKFRKVKYGNIWAVTKSGDWKPITKMMFTGDATAKKGYRMDYGGGAEKNYFYLSNGGFFNKETKLKSVFLIENKSPKPSLDLKMIEGL
jgi:hypothetical protein